MKKILILVMMLCMGLLSVVQADLVDGLIAYWPFDDNFDDLTGNGFNCTPVGSPTFDAGLLSGAVDINGDAGNYLTNELVLPRAAGTISTWVKSNNASNDRQVIYYESDGNYDGWSGDDDLEIHTALRTTGRVYTLFQDGEGNTGVNTERGWHSANNTIVLDEWNHIVMTWEAPGNKITYINGAALSTQSIKAPLKGAATYHMIGVVPNNSDNRGLDGLLDDVAIWDRALTVEEIAELYNEGAGTVPIQPPLVKNPIPSDGAVDVPIESVDLSWTGPDPAEYPDATYTVLIGVVDPNEDPTHPSIQTFETGSTTSVNVGDLEYDTKYFWRVDTDPGDPNDEKGRLWSFDTMSQGPYITGDPVDQLVDLGSDAEFVVTATAILPESYQWYKDGAVLNDDGNVSGTTTNTLTITGAAESNNGTYHCVVSNALEGPRGTVASASANMAIKELMAYWPLDSDSLDYSGNNHHMTLMANDSNTLNDEVPAVAPFVAGQVGQGLEFDGSSQFGYAGTWNPSELSGQLTISLWAKWNGSTNQYQGIIGKRSNWSNPNLSYWQIELNRGTSRTGTGNNDNLDRLKGLQRNETGFTTETSPLQDTSLGWESTEGGMPFANLEHTTNASQRGPQAFDNNSGTKWLAQSAPSVESPIWVGYEFADGQARVITTYALTSANDVPERDPDDWTFEGSNDGQTWDILDTQTGQAASFPARRRRLVYSIANQAAYKMYRINITKNMGDGNTQFSELQMYDSTVPEEEFWTHVAVSFDGVNSRLYVNGVEVASTTGWTFGPEPAANMGIGAINLQNLDLNDPAEIRSTPWAGNFYNGALDEIRIYNYALDKYEVAQIAATEGNMEVCPEHPALDYDQSCTVDVGDLLIILEDWMKCNSVPECL